MSMVVKDYIAKARDKFKVEESTKYKVRTLEPEKLQDGGVVFIPMNKKDIVDLIPLLQSMVAKSQKFDKGDTDFARHRSLIDMLEIQASEALVAIVDDVPGKFYCQCE